MPLHFDIDFPVALLFDHDLICLRPRWPHSVILEKEGPNDGLVSIESAKWVSLVLCGSSLSYVRAMLESFHRELMSVLSRTLATST
jgi:hypothetical protein